MFRIDVPIDASGAGAARALRVLALPRDGAAQARSVEIDARGQALAVFELDEKPRALDVVIGPEGVTDDELVGMDAPTLSLPPRVLRRLPRTKLAPYTIPSLFARQWSIRCRSHTVRGRVVRADGRPIAGAIVDAADLSAFWWWSSRRHVARAVTSADGSFTMTFRWCCGWKPDFWIARRAWQVDPAIAAPILAAIGGDPRRASLPIPLDDPDLSLFAELLPATAITRSFTRSGVDPASLAPLRERLLQALPRIPEIDRAGLWPFHPWQPWWDSAPALAFRVMERIGGEPVVILDEGAREARHVSREVTLLAGIRLDISSAAVAA